MKEPPGGDQGRKDQKPESLVALEEATLLVATLLFSDGLLVRLDKSIGHGRCKSEGEFLDGGALSSV